MADSIFKRIGTVVGTAISEFDTRLSYIETTLGITEHTHEISSVTGLQDILDNKIETETLTSLQINDHVLTYMDENGSSSLINIPKNNFKWIEKNSDYTAVAFDAIAFNTNNNPFTIFLPNTPSVGERIKFLDVGNMIETNNLTIGRNTQKIMGLEEDMTVSTTNIFFELVFISIESGWRLC